MPWSAFSGLVALGIAACSGQDQEEPAGAAGAPAGTIVDSIFPIEEEIRRFRATLSDAPDRLSSGEPTRDELIRRFVASVEAADTLALRDMLLTRSEFAYLYYPHTIYTSPPYELSPALLWFQIETNTSQGFVRLMQRWAGSPLRSTGYKCDAEPKIEGKNRIWSRCRIQVAPPGGDPQEVALFGSILERDGLFKFISYANDL